MKEPGDYNTKDLNQTDKYHTLSFICVSFIKKNDTNEFIQKRETDSHAKEQNSQLSGWKGGGRERDRLGGQYSQVHIAIFKIQIINKDLLKN